MTTDVPPPLAPLSIPAAGTPSGLPPLLKPALSPEQTLRRLFLTLFLRGRSSRGLQKKGVPQSVGRKLAATLIFYALFGFFALNFLHQSLFGFSVYLHGITFMLLGMFVVSSAGEVLFNQQEADILLHRPIEPRTLLWAKIGVMVQVSLWLAGAFNLAGTFGGMAAAGATWVFPLVHVVSTALEALFCTGTVVLLYQLCLRSFGRERLDSLMTTAQVLLAITAMAAFQIIPRMNTSLGGVAGLSWDSWWLALFPPAWFAGLDDAFAGQGGGGSWILAVTGLVVTAAVLWFAFGKLADNYVSGLQTLGEAGPANKALRPRRRWLEKLVDAPPLSWWLRDSVARASFLLTLAYLTRDRDVKLRVYPGLAPILVMPFIMLMQGHGRYGNSGGMGGFGIAFSGAYLGLIPMLALGMLQFSQHWQAADLFRVAPLAGPARLYHGCRRAVLLFMALPLAAVFGVVAWLTGGDAYNLLLLLPGLILLPLYALIPGLGGQSVPLSQPMESAKAAGRGWKMMVVVFLSMALAGVTAFAWSRGWFGWFVLGEFLVVSGLYIGLRIHMNTQRWASME